MDITPFCRDNLLAIAEAYAEATGLSLSTVSKKFHGNQAFLGKYRKGEGSIIVSTLQEMVDRFREAWPRGTKWPGRGPFSRHPSRG